jgi:hypothetical protein
VARQSLLDRAVAITSGPEAKGRIMKLLFEDGTQEAPKHFLSDPISNCWDTQRTEFAVSFVNELTPERLRLKGAVLQSPDH